MKTLLTFLLTFGLVAPCWAAASVSSDGTNNVITCTRDASVDDLTTMTVAFWVYFDDAGDSFGRIVDKKDGGTGWSVLYCSTNGAPCDVDERIALLRDFSTTDGLWTMTTLVVRDVWLHVAITYDNSATTNDPAFYLGGVLETTVERDAPVGTAVTDASESVLVLNQSGLARDIVGSVSQLHIYNRILSAGEVVQIMHHPGSITGGLVMYQPFLTQDGNDLSPAQTHDCTFSGTADSTLGPPVYLHGPGAWWKHLRRAFASASDWLMPLAWADDVILYDPDDATVPNRVTSYQRSVPSIASGAAANPNSLIWSLPMSSVNPWDGVVPTAPQAYWKVVDGAVVEMSQAEKDAVDAPALAAAAEQAAFEAEVVGNDWCAATLDELTTRIDNQVGSLQTSLDATSTQAQTKAWMRDTLVPTVGTGFKKLAKCIRGRAQ